MRQRRENDGCKALRYSVIKMMDFVKKPPTLTVQLLYLRIIQIDPFFFCALLYLFTVPKKNTLQCLILCAATVKHSTFHCSTVTG